MDFLNYIFNGLMRRRLAQIENFKLHPHEVQQKVFNHLIQSAQYTEWGKKYGYARIKSVADFQKQVPVSTYEALFPYIERCLKGEQNVLWSTPIKWFSKSSGTTNARNKFIPVSNESFQGCHYKAGKDLIAMYVRNNPHTKIFTGKNMGVGGSLQRNHLNPRTHYGDVSALLMKNLPLWAEFMRTPSIETALMEKWEDKITRMAEETKNLNVTSMQGVPTWSLMILKKVLEVTRKKHIKEVWKNFELYVHGGVSFAPYYDSFKQIMGEEVRFMETYNASEGFFGVQDQLDRDDMLLMLDYGIYYEFIPFEELHNENPKVLTLQEVETGKNYALVISTNGGLWRYLIGDLVKFTSTSPYRIKVTGRTKHYINAFGEELMVENAEQALTFTCRELGARISNFTAAPIYLTTHQKGGHEWIIEFEKEPQNIEQFTILLDYYLRQINADYDAKRSGDIALGMPVVHVAPKGTFYEWLKKRGKLGGQNKVPRLANDRQFVEELLSMMQKALS
ncbi:MAG: GH3 auxin-responsive promoter family protein [Cytophagales bacterium]|nr:GH3 auxin-responsive promoter family protein [Cytophagales bacterium]MDW8384091.1 GH3 auxin-responsive promoter family protein [Flammeovirgaceae bacterium]